MQQAAPIITTNRDLTMSSSGATQENAKHSAGDFLCRMCNKSFAYKKNYDDHYIVHDVEQICGTGLMLSAPSQSDATPPKKLKIHACDQCDKAYHRKDHLTRHKLDHTGERPHICIVCLKSFVRKDKLTRHEKIHYKDSRVQFECPDCDRKFLRKDSMEKHRKMHCHQGMSPEKMKSKTKCSCAASVPTVDKYTNTVNSESIKDGLAMSIKSAEMKTGNEASSVNSQSSIYNSNAGSTHTSSVSKNEGHNGNNGNSLHNTVNTGAFKNDSQSDGNVKRENEHTANTDSTMKHPRCGGSVESMPVSQPRGYWFDPRQGHGHPHFFNPSTGFTQEMDLRVNYQCQINCSTGKSSNDNGWAK